MKGPINVKVYSRFSPIPIKGKRLYYWQLNPITTLKSFWSIIELMHLKVENWKVFCHDFDSHKALEKLHLAYKAIKLDWGGLQNTLNQKSIFGSKRHFGSFLRQNLDEKDEISVKWSKFGYLEMVKSSLKWPKSILKMV